MHNYRFNNVRTEIRKLGMTQQEFADILGISFRTLQYRISQDKNDLHLIVRGVQQLKQNEEG